MELNLGEFAGRIPVELSGGASFPQLGQLPLPADAAALRLLTGSSSPRPSSRPQWSTATAGIEPEHLTFVVRRGVGEVVEGKSRETLERDVLPGYAPHRRWFQRKDQQIQRAEVVTAIPLPGAGKDILMGLVGDHDAVGAGALRSAVRDLLGRRVAGALRAAARHGPGAHGPARGLSHRRLRHARLRPRPDHGAGRGDGAVDRDGRDPLPRDLPVRPSMHRRRTPRSSGSRPSSRTRRSSSAARRCSSCCASSRPESIRKRR